MRNVWILSATLLLTAAANGQTGTYTVKNIVTNVQDPKEVNPWGLSRPINSGAVENHWWIADQGTGLSTLYDASGAIIGLQVTIPPASGTGTGSPTGVAFNQKNFAFTTLDGTIANWFAGNKPAQPGSGCLECHVNVATTMVNHSGSHASYQGLTVAKNATSAAQTYYAANANGGIEAYDATSFSPVTLPAGAFTDSKVPAGYTPAGIQAVGSKIFVTYNASAGGGTGYVTEYDTNGKLILRLQTGWFSRPWGVAKAPSSFGPFSNMILVGNTASGWIGAYNASTGKFAGFLQSNTGGDVTIPGLWGLEFGDGAAESGPTNVLYFTAGGASYTAGAFGSITAN